MRSPSDRHRLRRLRRGTTLIEMLLYIVLNVIVLGSVATLYLFTIQQCGQATAAVGAQTQANAAMDAIATTVRQSMVCAAMGAPPPAGAAVKGLRCTLPANGMDTDGDGNLDVWLPDKFDAKGKPTYTKGVRVWFYQADSTGKFGTVGTILWRATRTDDSNPTAADADKSWSLYYGGSPRYGLVDSIGFTVSGSSAIVTATLSASASARKPDTSGATATNQDDQSANLSQVLSWRTDFD